MTRVARLLGVLLLGTTTPLWALSTDRDQPVIVDADSMELDFNTGERAYIGNATVQQGTLKLWGERIDMKYKDDELDIAIARGKPAKFKQRPDGETEDVSGRAQKLTLNQKTDTIHMLGKAVLTRGADTIRGHEIHYDINTSRMIAKGRPATAGKKGEQQERTRIRLQPKSKPEAQ